MQGPWDDPIVLPDARSLIRRSGGAPLLDAVRDRKVRDQMRETIERMTRDGGTAFAPAAATPPSQCRPARRTGSARQLRRA